MGVYSSGGIEDLITVSGIVYQLHVFNETDYLIVDSTIQNVEYMTVAGGGGGGACKWTNNEFACGGGGGGGKIGIGTFASLAPGSYLAQVGSGGAAGVPGETFGGIGNSSAFNSYGAPSGGSPGHAYTTLFSTGARAGGTEFWVLGVGFTGYSGGLGSQSANAYGGGGGASPASNGNNGTSTTGGNGANGYYSDFTGAFVYYGGGGGGGVYYADSDYTAGLGGLGGGGNAGASGAGSLNRNGQNGTPNTGGGGGGASTASATYDGAVSYGGAGGSGVVMVRYPVSVSALGNSFDLTSTLLKSKSFHSYSVTSSKSRIIMYPKLSYHQDLSITGRTFFKGRFK